MPPLPKTNAAFEVWYLAEKLNHGRLALGVLSKFQLLRRRRLVLLRSRAAKIHILPDLFEGAVEDVRDAVTFLFDIRLW